MFLKKFWWKLLAAALILVVLNRGLLTPLKHGIVDLSPTRVQAGTTAGIEVIAYNSHYDRDPAAVRAYLRPHRPASPHHEGELLLAASSVEVQSANRLRLKFDLPAFLPDPQKLAAFSLIVDSPGDGPAVIPGKLIIGQDSIREKDGVRAWTSRERPEFSERRKHWFPYRNILVETIRNTFFHVSLWFAMFLLLALSVYYSVRYLRHPIADYDLRAFALVRTAMLCGLLGCLTGSLWARYTWETWWTTDIKLNMAALTLLIYLAYWVLRLSIEDPDRRRRISAAYNAFALAAVIPLIFVLPRLTDSLHPGSGGNPAIGADDMDNALRMVFYPSVLGFMLLGLWLASLLYRVERLEAWHEDGENIF
jgi:heme exporter protein C